MWISDPDQWDSRATAGGADVNHLGDGVGVSSLESKALGFTLSRGVLENTYTYNLKKTTDLSGH